MNLKTAARNAAIIAVSIILIAVIGYVDVITGFEIKVSIFYLIPVAFASWYIGLRSGMAVAILATIALYWADIASGAKYSHSFIPVWNGLMIFLFIVIVVLLMSSLKKELETQKHLAMEDFLTKASNGRAFYNYANMEVARLKRYGTPLTIVYFDMDDFKKINDTMGHKAGNELLVTLINSVRRNIRATDVVGRLGGDEFAMLLPDMDKTAAVSFVRFISETMAVELKKHGWNITFSAGVVIYTKPPKSIDEMIKLADLAMYSIKKHGKNGVKYIACD